MPHNSTKPARAVRGLPGRPCDPSLMFNVRLPVPLFEAVGDAARASGQSASEWARRAILAALRRQGIRLPTE